MPNLRTCLDAAAEDGKISHEDADRIGREYDRARARAALDSDATASAEAKRLTAELLKAETAHQRRKAKMGLQTIRRIAEDLRTHKLPDGTRDVASGALYLLEHNTGEAQFSSVAGRQAAITGEAHARMEHLLHTFRRGAVLGDKGRHNAAQLPNVVRELFGEETGDAAAKGLAAAWSDTAEWLRLRFNAAGGAIGKLENWGLPQRHDPRALRKVGREAWIERIEPMLAPERMVHPLTGTEVLPGELDEVLGAIWDRIANDGWNERQPLRQAFGKGALANQHAEHRFLVFKDADTWMAYQRDFGGGSDAFANMMGHVNMMAKDVAAMEVLGPSPGGTIEWLKQLVAKEASNKAAGKPHRFGGRGDPLDRASKISHRIDAVWGSIRGSLNTPVSTFWADTLGGARDFITSSVLGGAAISSLSDIGTAQVTRAFAGISGGQAGDLIRAFTPERRREAVMAGLILDNAVHVFQKQARYIGTLGGPEWLSYLGDRVLTYSGLTPMTQAGKHAFGLAFIHEVANQADRAWAKMHPEFRSIFEQAGLREKDWDRIRRRAIYTSPDGLTLLRPTDIMNFDRHLGERYLEMVQTLTERAIPSGGHRSRTVLLDQNRPGTLVGELIRSFAQFKSFGAAYAMLHGAETMRRLKGNGKWNAAGYAASILITGTFMGALSMQLKSVAAGRDPQPMNTWQYWTAALMQGGGFGLYGDFLFADVNRYGGGLTGSVAGPLVERVSDFRELTLGNLAQLAAGEETHFGRELVKFARGNTPGGTIWYLRLAYERMVLDQVQFLVDPEANAAFKRSQANWARNTGQGFWWAPGTATPQRAPNLGNAINSPP